MKIYEKMTPHLTRFCWAYMQSAGPGALIRSWVSAAPAIIICVSEEKWGGSTDSDLPPQ